jgi:uncharacterized membrane protein
LPGKEKEMTQNMVEHHAAVTVDAPLHQVYTLFSHFNDFPKFMSFVKEVTYYDDQRSHWVANVSGQHEWDAVNEDWIPDRQIGWRAINGLNNYGRVIFQPASAQQTHLDVYVNYQPPAGVLGSIGERMGVGKHFDDVLQKDLNHFAEMVHQAPANALDPNSSAYLFHNESAASQGTTTERQNATMGGEFTTENAQGEREQISQTNLGEPPVGGYTPPPGSGASAQGTLPPREDTLVDRPVLDRDILNEPLNRDLPPEQMPRWEHPEGEQPQP